VLAHARDVDGNAVIDVGGGQEVTIEAASLHSDDFLLASSTTSVAPAITAGAVVLSGFLDVRL